MGMVKQMNERVSRRDFLKQVTNAMFSLGGLLGLGGLVRFFSFEPDAGPPMEFDLGDAGDFPSGSRTLRPDIPAVVYNRDGVFTAVSLVCTHLGCMVEPDGEAYACPCHGSRFGPDGDLRQGPAQKPLAQLRVELQADNTLKLFKEGGRG